MYHYSGHPIYIYILIAHYHIEYHYIMIFHITRELISPHRAEVKFLEAGGGMMAVLLLSPNKKAIGCG